VLSQTPFEIRKELANIEQPAASSEFMSILV